MKKYILFRILAIFPILLFAVFITFGILNFTPGDPGRIILGQKAKQEDVDKMNHSLGVDKPLLERYVRYVFAAVQGDFGLSYRTQKPVFNEVFAKFPTTLTITFMGVLCASLIGIPLGIISAIKQYSFIDISLTVGSLILASIPTFLLGILLIIIFALKLKWLPSSGIGSFKFLILPIVTLAFPSAAFLSRMTRATMLETMRQDYIRTAKAKGASKSRVIFKHALRNAIMPIITIIGFDFAGLLGGALITEVVFGLPGVGSIILTSIKMKDVPMIMASMIFLSIVFMLIVLILDLLYALIDPRIKAQY